ncbi:response regulator [Komarekiella sp. 'clone 1']|uniref:Response regulator n=1 Tax=Komarekiella delphini-convector SJRDD-AB1 TaxID=2593771 RepID=A0AA40VNY9_9NOST|nr:response regulator [Komarekiella delphini-convector SJRDD-AB1]
MKILVVEDDKLNAHVLTTVLTGQNYVVEVATDGDVAWDLIQTYDYDLILLDIILPKLDGISLCRQIRSGGLQVPILLLTGRDSGHEKAIGLDAGADDYVVKPFNEEELVARVRALLRRGGNTSQPVLEWRGLRLDPSSCEVTYASNLLSLTPKEYALLELFLRNSRRVFSCGMILEHLWSYDDTPTEEAVRTHIKGLRHKLKAVGVSSDLIETIYGIGYRLKPLEGEGGKGKRGEGEKGRGKEGGKISHAKARMHRSQEEDLSKQQQTLRAVAGVWQQFKGRVDEQVSVLEQAVAALNSESPLVQGDRNLLLEAAQEAHTLAGSLGTFGFTLGSKLARKIERLLNSEQILSVSEITNLECWVKLLRQEIEGDNEVAAISALPSGAELSVSVVKGDCTLTHSTQVIELENRWRTIFDAEPECVKVIAVDGTLLEINPAGILMLEANNTAALIGKSVYKLIAPEYQEAFRQLNASVCQGNKGILQFEMISCEGNRRWVETHAVPLCYDDGKVVLLAITRDITPHKQAEAKIRRLNRKLQTLSSCNQVLFRAKDEFDLLQQICQILVKIGGYRLAWVGFAEDDIAKSIRPVSQAGYEDGYLQSLNLTWANTSHEQSPMGIAIRTGEICIVQNILTDHNYQIWQSHTINRGYASAIALPLIINGQTFAALNIYAAEPDTFDADEVKVLQALAADLAYGIVTLRNQRDRQLAKTAELISVNRQLQSELDEHRQTHKELRLSQARFARILDIADDAIISIGHDLYGTTSTSHSQPRIE